MSITAAPSPWAVEAQPVKARPHDFASHFEMPPLALCAAANEINRAPGFPAAHSAGRVCAGRGFGAARLALLHTQVRWPHRVARDSMFTDCAAPLITQT